MHAPGPVFRELLRHWRRCRGLSQLRLATEAGISTRHLSFLETGRSRPSRDMIDRLADHLELAPADRMTLLLAAGYAPAPMEPDAVDFQAYERMLAFILAQQKSVPALVIDERWNIRMRNEVAAKLFGTFRRHFRMPESVSQNALHIVCHPGGLRPFIANWREYAEPFARAIDREATIGGSTAIGLRTALSDYNGVEELLRRPGEPQSMTGMPPMMHLESDDHSLRFHMAFTTFDLPFAAKSQSLKIEYLYPADTVTAQTISRLCERPS